MEKPTVEKFREILPLVCDEKTSSDPEGWKAENPLWGHCAVVTLAAQALFGGTLRRGSLEGTPFEKMRSHYWNRFSDLVVANKPDRDYTAIQFHNHMNWSTQETIEFMKPIVIESEERTREYLLSNADTKKRYQLLMWRLSYELSGNNKIFFDEKFRRCYKLAFSENANCPKMRFATVVYDGDRKIAEEVNRHLGSQFGKPRFCSFDGTECIRLGIQSRMDALTGDCGHSPQWALRKVFDLGYKPADLPKLDFYEAGFMANGLPWWRQEPSYTCLYCQNAFALFGLDKIWGTVEGSEIWNPLWTKDSFYNSADYATGKKKA